MQKILCASFISSLAKTKSMLFFIALLLECLVLRQYNILFQYIFHSTPIYMLQFIQKNVKNYTKVYSKHTTLAFHNSNQNRNYLSLIDFLHDLIPREGIKINLINILCKICHKFMKYIGRIINLMLGFDTLLIFQ